MEILENKQPQKRRMPKAARIALAAALVVGCLLSIAAAMPEFVYHFLGSGSVSGNPVNNGGHITITLPDKEDAPIVLEDGRLWFVNSGERTDITDLIDENTPYIYEHTDPGSKSTGYVIVGGTVDNFGWMQYVNMGGGAATVGNNYCQDYVILDGKQFLISELTEEQLAMDNLVGKDVYHPWCLSAMTQLGIVP